MTPLHSIDPGLVRSILVLPFEDIDVVTQLRERFPKAAIRELTKLDLAGRSLPGLVRLIRAQPVDLTVVSIAGSTVNRTIASAEILTGVAPGRYRFLRTTSAQWRAVTPWRFWGVRVPLVALAIAAGLLGVALVTLIVAAMLLRRSRPRRPEQKQRRTVLFIRADVAGAMVAGGSVSHIKGVVSGFEQQGYHVVYLADVRQDALPASVVQEIVPPIQWMDVLDEFQQVWYNLQLAYHLPRILARHRVSVVYQRHAVLHVMSGLVSAVFGLPFILEANGSEVWAKQQWSRLVLTRLARWCESAAARWSQTTVAVSEAAARQFDPEGRWRDRRMVIPNGVDPSVFRPDIDGTDVRRKQGWTSEIVVGFTGTFNRWHGVEVLTEAALRLVTDDSQIRILLIGDGALRSRLEARVRQEGKSDRIVFTGMIRHEVVPAHLAACDVLVAPHSGFDDGSAFFGSPTKLFEYLSMGKAIVASRLGQIAEIIEDGRNGLLAQPGSVDELAEAIRRAAFDPALRLQLGSAARKDAVDRYSWNRNVERLLASLETIV